MKFNYLECRILYKNKKKDRIDTKRQVVTSKIIINESLQKESWQECHDSSFTILYILLYSSINIFEKGESSE